MAAVFAGCSGGDQPKPQVPDDKLAETNEPESVEPVPDEADQAHEDETAQEPVSADIIEPEQLISRDEAAELLGQPVKQGEKTDQQVVGQKLINYDAEDENAFAFLQVSLQQQAYMPEGGGMTPEGIFESTIGAFDAEEVPDIGDEAYFATPGLHIMAHGYYISIGAGNSDDEAVRTILKQAGTLAVANLEKLIGQ